MYILGVTSCPVGIAHTYMAASNLEKTAKKKGLEIKIETQGAAGVENEITKEDLKRAAAVIIACYETKKNAERFDDLPTLTVGVSEAIKDAEGIIKELLEALE